MITPKLAQQIRLMRDAVKACNCYCMEKFDGTPDFMKPIDPEEEPDEGLFPMLEEWDGRTECTVLHVDDRRFSWHSIIKHTNITMETDGVDISEIRWL
jgi:hypothetical protein